MRVSLLFLCLLFGLSGAVQAKRIALVIGNDAYSNLPSRYQLQKARNDARATAETFKALGFQVIKGFDLTRREMNIKLSTFTNSIDPGDEVMFFFAGHGVRIEGLNYLLPSDIPSIDGASEDLLKSESVRVDEISDRFRKKGARLSILVLDACRNNPYENSNGRSLGGTRGLAAMDPPEGTLVLFSAGAGQQALDRLDDDDANPNSVFTRIFLPLVRKKGLELSRLSRQVKAKVRDLARTINHTQTPAVYNEVIGDVFLSGRGSAVSNKNGNREVKSASELLWNSIEQSKNASDFKFYLSEHPKGRHSSLAKLKLRQMAALQVPTKPKTKKLAEPAIGIFKDKYAIGRGFKDCTECPEMIVVPPGGFMMGSPKSEKERDKDEGPRHKVTIAKKFAVGKFTVTRDQFELFINDSGHDVGNKCWIYEGSKWKERSGRFFKKPGFRQDGNHPAVCVNWDDAKAFVRWLNKKVQGSPYKLLSEAEWEYVARAKTDTPFWWGQSISTSQANYDGNYTYNGSKGNWRKRTVSVDSFEPNDFGLYNVHGNVWEWVEDCWHKSYRGAPKDGKAWIRSGECSKRVLRGGSWSISPENLRSANRDRYDTDVRSIFFGFRVSRTLAR